MRSPSLCPVLIGTPGDRWHPAIALGYLNITEFDSLIEGAPAQVRFGNLMTLRWGYAPTFSACIALVQPVGKEDCVP